MKKSFVYGLLCALIFAMFLCVGCGKEANSNETGTDGSSGQAGREQEASSEESEGIHLEFDPATKTMLTWMAPRGVPNSDDDIYIAFNNLLDRKGYDFYVNFYTPGNDSEEYVKLIHKAAASGQEIDIFSTGYGYCAGMYAGMALDGLCQELNVYMEDAEGRAFYDTKDELVWEGVSVEGKIYGVSGHPKVATLGKQYYYVNPEIAEKYEIDCERLFEDTSYFYDSIFAVEEGERADGEFEPYIKQSNLLFDYPEDMIEVWEPIALRRDSEGSYRAVNIYEDERIRRAIIACHELRKRGHTVQVYSQAQIEAGKYFIVVSGQPLECDNAVGFIRPPYAGNQEGAITCIASWSENKEAAFELLCAVHTDRELSEMLAFGIEGINYRVEGDKILKSDVAYAGNYYAASLLTNRQLLRDSDYDIPYSVPLSEEEKAALRENPLFGNPLDCRGIKDQLKELSECEDFSFPSQLNGSSWTGQDFDQMYEEGLQKLRDAGIDEVLDELNQQLKERGLQ